MAARTDGKGTYRFTEQDPLLISALAFADVADDGSAVFVFAHRTKDAPVDGQSASRVVRIVPGEDAQFATIELTPGYGKHFALRGTALDVMSSTETDGVTITSFLLPGAEPPPAPTPVAAPQPAPASADSPCTKACTPVTPQPAKPKVNIDTLIPIPDGTYSGPPIEPPVGSNPVTGIVTVPPYVPPQN